MCLWLITACLGLLPSNPSTVVVYPSAVPAPILLPTTAGTTTITTTTTTNTTRPPTQPSTNFTVQPTMTPPPFTNIPTNGGALLPVILCLDDPETVCTANPNDAYATGSLAIDPRLGTTPGAPAAYQQAPQITAYSGQIPNYNMAVKFPRNRRNVHPYFPVVLNESQRHVIKRRQTQFCNCVPAGTCTTGVQVVNNNYYGAGMIDFRIVNQGGVGQCPAGQVYCCTGANNGNYYPPAQQSPTIACGVQQSVPNTAVQPSAGQANYGEYPWQALILTKQNDFIGGGVLIDQQNVLTVTHRMQPYLVSGTAPNVKVRLGEWDAAGTYEPIPFQEYSVSKAFSHPSYSPGTLQYDITVLRLASQVPLSPMNGAAPTINRACLPPSQGSNYNGQRCWVSGWGKNMFGLQGQYQQILKEVDVPIVDSGTCQTQMRNARLGSSFVLDTTSFICAGGEANKDSCTGDGGSGLVCQANGQFVVVGLVAWGLGCANPSIPAAYVNVAALLPWIQQQVATP